MAFVPWKKNKQIMINNIQEDPAKSQNQSATKMTRSNIVEQSNIINMNGFKSHPDHEGNYGSVGSGSVNGERTSFININRLKFFGRRGSSSTSTTTHENENKPIDSEIDCTLRLGFPTEPPSKPQQQVQLKPQEEDHHLSAVINNYFPPNNVVPQELMQNYELMNGTPSYHQPQPQPQPQPINNRFGMNNFNQNNYQLQQQIMNNHNMIVSNHGMFHGEGSPSTMNVGGNSISENNMIINNHGMFHGGGSPSPLNVGENSSSNNNMIVNNHGMFHGGGSLSPMNVGGNGSNNNMIVNNHGMFLGSPSTMNVGGNSSGSSNMIVGNHGMFHGGGSHNNMIFNNHGMFNGGGNPSTMNVGGNGSIGNNFGMFHGGRGGGDPSSVVVALPSPGGGTLGDGFNTYNIPHPLPPPPPNNFHVPFPNNNIPPPFPQLLPAPPVFLAAPRGNGPYYQNYPPPPEPEKRCFACDTTRTPLWRNGPKGPKSLCNACGIRYKKEVRRLMGAVVGTDGGQQGEAAYRRNRF